MTDPRTAPRESAPQPRYTALRERHEALGASFTDFGGWAMPVRYTSDLAEHHAVRTAAGLFDISHMAEFYVSGGRGGRLPRLGARREALHPSHRQGEVLRSFSTRAAGSSTM